MLGIFCRRRTVGAVEKLPEEIAQHYEEEIDEGLRITEGFGQLELVRTQEVIRPHLSGGPLSIIDIGGGTGVHAAWLAEDGHAVHVIDPVPRHVKNVRELSNGIGRSPQRLATPDSCERMTRRSTPRWSWDPCTTSPTARTG